MVVRVFPVIRRVVLACTLSVVLSLAADSVSAHGILQRSSPRGNALLPVAPAEILLEFNEAVDARFSRAEVIGPQGGVVARGGDVGGGGRRLRLPLAGEEAGVYTVRWRVLSAVDGHTATGSFLFAVGGGTGLPAAPVSSPPAFPPLTLVVARWFSYLAALLLAGTVVFRTVIFERVLDRMDPAAIADGRASPLAAVDRLRVVSAYACLAALLVEFVAQGGEVVGGGIAPLLRRDVLSSLLIETRLGWGFLVRAYAAVLLLMPDRPSGRILRAAGLVWVVIFTAVVFFLGGPSAVGSSHVALIVLVGSVYGLASVLAARIVPAIPDVRVPEWRGAALAASGVMLAGFTITSHAGGNGGVVAVFDWLHLAAAAVWVGGLPALIAALRTVIGEARVAFGRALVPRVSAIAGVSLLVLVLTGTAATWTFVASLQGLTGTAYGRTLMLKLSLVGVIAILGAVNRFILRPRIAAHDGMALHTFRRTATVEVIIGVAILLIVAALGIMPPAAQTPPRPADDGVLYAGQWGETRVLVRVTPAAAGLNEITVDGARASVRLRHLETFREAPVRPDGSAELSDGWWEIVVTGERGQTTFPLVVGSPPARSDPDASRELARARVTMSRVRTWREIEQITDGSGHAVETRFEAVRPDQLRYRTTSGSEAVIIGAVRFSRDRGGVWTRDRLPQPIALDGPYLPYLDGAAAVRFGGTDRCGGEICRVVLWALPSGRARFAARIGSDGRIYRVAMVAPAHYMTSRVDRLNAPLLITPP